MQRVVSAAQRDRFITLVSSWPLKWESIKELSEALRDKIIGAYESGRFKNIAKEAESFCLEKWLQAENSLMFHRENVGKEQDFWNNVLWTDECKTEWFGHQKLKPKKSESRNG